MREDELERLLQELPERYRGPADLEAVVHWDVGQARLQTVLARGTCTPGPPDRDPDVVLRATPDAFGALAAGTARPLRLALDGDLVVEGSLPLALAVSGAFAVPGEEGRPVAVDPSTLDADLFAREVATTKDGDLERLLSSAQIRDEVLRGIFDRMPTRFRPEKAKGLDKVFHWKVFDRPGGGYDHFEVVIRDQECHTSPEPREDPDTTFRAKPVDFVKVCTGNANPVRLALTRRLHVLGDIGAAKRFGDVFSVPKG